MRTAATLALVLTLGLTGACKNEQATANQTEPAQTVGKAGLTPEQLGELGAALRKDPARAQEILTQRGMTPQAFEKAIREVTENPEASKRYADAYRKASA